MNKIKKNLRTGLYGTLIVIIVAICVSLEIEWLELVGSAILSISVFCLASKVDDWLNELTV